MMKKLLALLLALLTIAALTACNKDNDDVDDLSGLASEEKVITSYTDGDSVFHFEQIDVNTVAITGYEGPTQLHPIKIPAQVETGAGDSKKTVARIEEEAFKNISSIKLVEIPDTVTSIGRYAFAYCAHLETVSFYNTAINEEKEVVYGGSRLSIIEEGAFLESGLTSLDFLQQCYYKKVSKDEQATILEDTQLTAIANYTFWRCNKLESVTIPANIKSIGVAAFLECQGLKTVVLSEGVETVEKMAFVNCPKLMELRLPASLNLKLKEVEKEENPEETEFILITPIEHLAFLGSDVLDINGVIIPDKLPEGGDQEKFDDLNTYRDLLAQYLQSTEQ